MSEKQKKSFLEIESKKSKLEDLEYCTSDNQIATVQKANDTGNEIILNIQSIAEGSCKVYVRSASGEESNRVFINVVDQERVEQEKKEKEEAEKQAQREAEAQANKYSGSQRNTNNTHGEKVYRTPHGKRYHFDSDCGGKNSYQITMDAAISSGLTPCKKCAQ